MANSRYLKTIMSQIRIAKNLKQAVEMGPEHTADLIRQKLTVLLYQLEDGLNPVIAIKQFQILLGMNDIPVSMKEDRESI